MQGGTEAHRSEDNSLQVQAETDHQGRVPEPGSSFVRDSTGDTGDK